MPGGSRRLPVIRIYLLLKMNVAREIACIGIIIIIISIIGILLALGSEQKYTSTSQVIREISSAGSNSSLAALRGLGLNMGTSSVGLVPETIPDIIRSREVALAVAKDLSGCTLL